MTTLTPTQLDVLRKVADGAVLQSVCNCHWLTFVADDPVHGEGVSGDDIMALWYAECVNAFKSHMNGTDDVYRYELTPRGRSILSDAKEGK
jgi:hypothetical protein